MSEAQLWDIEEKAWTDAEILEAIAIMRKYDLLQVTDEYAANIARLCRQIRDHKNEAIDELKRRIETLPDWAKDAAA